MKNKITFSRLAILFFLLLAAFTTLFPFYFMLVSSFKTKAEYYINFFSIPFDLTLQNFTALFERFNVLKMIGNSSIVNLVAIPVSTFVVTLAGFIFAKFPYKGSNTIFMLIVACMMVPPIVLIIPVYLMMSHLGLVNNYLSLIITYVCMSIPFSLYLATSNFKLIPTECIESAKIDGAGLFALYYKIALPLGKPVILTLLTLNFLSFWNEFLYSMLFLQTNETRTLTVGVATIIGRYTVDMPLLFTGLLVNTIPVLIVFIFAQKYFVKGLTAGAVKG